MKKTIFLGILLIFLFGCTTQQLFICPDGSAVTDPSECPQELEQVLEEVSAADDQEEADEEPVAQPQERSIPDAIQEVLDKRDRVKSLSYLLKTTDNGPDVSVIENIHFWIKGDIIKRDIPFPDDRPGAIEQDVIIFDTASKTATAYCEHMDSCETTGEVGTVNYNEFYLKTPFDWAEEITSAENVGEVTLYDRKTWILEANDGMKVWLESYYGIPFKVEKGDMVYEFKYPEFNKVTDEEVGFVEIDG